MNGATYRTPSSFKGGFIYPPASIQSVNPFSWILRKLFAIMDVKHDEKSPTQGHAQELETVSPSNEVSSGEKLSSPDVYEESYVQHQVSVLQGVPVGSDLCR